MDETVGCLIAGALILAANLVILAASVWVAVTVLRAMGVAL